MKRIFLLSLALLATLSVQGQTALSGKRFTEAEMLNAFPDGIVKAAAYPMGWADNQTLRLFGEDRPGLQGLARAAAEGG